MRHMTYEEWVSGRVYISDARPFHAMLGGEFEYPDAFDAPRPFVMFLHPQVSRTGENEVDYDVNGYFRVLTDGRYDVIVENNEEIFDYIDEASRWLYDNWAAHNMDKRPEKFRFIYVSNRGEIDRSVEVEGNSGLSMAIYNCGGDEEMAREAFDELVRAPGNGGVR